MFKKQTDPSVKILVIGTFLFVLATSAYFIATKTTATKNETFEKAEDPIYFDFGSVTDSTYCNEFFGFKVPIPDGYQEDYKKYDLSSDEKTDSVVAISTRDTIPIIPRQPEEIDTEGLLLITPELIQVDMKTSLESTESIKKWLNYQREKSKREMWGSDFQLLISVKNLSGTNLNAYISLFENIHNPGYAEPKTRLISGKSFREYEGKEYRGNPVQRTFLQTIGVKNKEITSYFNEINGFALCIDLFYETEAQKAILDEIVASISFHEPMANTTP